MAPKPKIVPPVVKPFVLKLPTLIQEPSPNYSGRTAPIDLIVLHDCEGSYAGAVSWFGQHRSGVSAHIVLKEDGTEASQCVGYSHKAWHACNFNSRSIGVEMGGTEKRGFPDNEWQTAANVIAYLCHRFKIPPRFAANGQGSGFCRHLDLGADGGGHKDPTTDHMLWGKVIAKVEAAYKVGGFPVNPWGLN